MSKQLCVCLTEVRPDNNHCIKRVNMLNLIYGATCCGLCRSPPAWIFKLRIHAAVSAWSLLNSCMQIELMQVGPRGDLVVGSDELRIVSITSKATIVHWFELKTSSRSIGAELCLVLRYLSGMALCLVQCADADYVCMHAYVRHSGLQAAEGGKLCMQCMCVCL